MSTILRPAAVMLCLFTALTGVLYPLTVTAVARAAFPRQAEGSLIQSGDRLLGSTLIGQPVGDPRYFWGRPSATTPHAYDASASTGSNLGPSNPALMESVSARIEALRAADPNNTAPVPVDLVTTSASGLDPHISPAAARYQAARIARLRGLPVDVVLDLVQRSTEPPTLGLFGESRVHVLRLNMALDGVTTHR